MSPAVNREDHVDLRLVSGRLDETVEQISV